jgi:hypothetical protein
MLTFEVPIVRLRMGKSVGFAEKLPEALPAKPSPAARTLAMAHRIARAVESGELRDFSDAARRIGVSQARISMVVSLTLLAPKLQKAILFEGKRIGFKLMLKLARMQDWETQLAVMETLGCRKSDLGGNSPIRNPERETPSVSRPKSSRFGPGKGEIVESYDLKSLRRLPQD